MKNFFSLLVLVSFFSLNVLGQVVGDFRSKAAGPGNWNDFNSWERYNGTSWVAAISGQLPTATGSTEVQATHSIVINATGLVSGNLTVKGSLTYDVTTVSALTVTGNITVSGTGSFTSSASGTLITHALSLDGNLQVDGLFDMNVSSTAGVVVTFTGATNNTISGTGTTINFYSLVVNKGVVYTNILEVTSVITIAPPPLSPAAMRLTLTNGTFKLSSASILSPYSGQQTITSTNSRLWLNHAGATVQCVGAGTASAVGRLMVTGGRLHITAGTFSYGSGSDIHSFSSFLTLDGPSATLNLYGSMQVAYQTTFTMSDGNINLYPQAGNNLTSYAVLSLESWVLANPVINLTGGTITIVDPPAPASSVASLSASFIAGGTINFSGSTIRFGDGTSDKDGNANGYQISCNRPLGNVIVNNSTSSVKTTRGVKLSAAFSVGGNLTINAGVANKFLLNNFALTLSGNLVNSGTFTGDGTTGNSLVLNGTAQQVISGTGTFTNGNINNITLLSTSVAIPSVDLQVPLSVSNSLTLTSGTLGTTNASVFTIGRPASSTTFNMTRSGGSISLSPAYSLAGVTLGTFAYNAPTPAATITTGSELPAGSPITTFTINNGSGVTLNKAVSCGTLNLTAGILTTSDVNLITVTGTTPASIVGGSTTAYVNGPLTRTLPNNAAAANYKFPIGKTAYRLFEYETITTTGTGTATFKAEAFDAGPYPGSAGTGMATINTDKMWELVANLGSVVISSSKIRITEAGLVATNKIGQSNIATGSYNNVGGILGSGTISSRQALDYSNISSGTYFRIGTMGSLPGGNYAIGPMVPYAGYTGSYVTFQNAVDALADVSPGGHMIFEFQSDYVPSVEVYPIVIPTSFSGTASATFTFRPASSVGSVINFSSAGQIISNTGADYLIFDGRNGGTGSNMFLQFTNTSTTGSAITMTADVTYNQMLYCVLKGSGTATTTGILHIGPAGGSGFLTIDHCMFDGSGSSANCIYGTALGTNATITNCDFFNYRNGGGIYLSSSSANSIINNNNFYQTSAYNAVAGTTYGIYFGGGDNCQISNNNIGGSGPGLTGTWTISPSTPVITSFVGIYALGGSTVGSRLYNNRIQNFDWKTNASASWSGITVGGNMNTGTDGANYVGNNTNTGNILITCYSAGTLNFRGITAGGSSSFVEANIVGSININPNGATLVGSVAYLVYNTGSQVVRNNILGSATVAQSFYVSTTGATNAISGVFSMGGTINVTGNTIANLYIAGPGMTRGIENGNVGSTISYTNNTIFNITMTGASATLIGIYDGASGTSTSNIISGNTIYNLINNGTGTGTVTGILFHSSDNASNIVEKNLVHSFVSTSNTVTQSGIAMDYGTSSFRNNVVRLGIDMNGNSITNTPTIMGMNIAIATGCCVPPQNRVNIYFNTVYVGGTGVLAGTQKTYAFYLANHSNYGGAGLGEVVQNNIFVNERTNAVPNLLHYAVYYPAAIAGIPFVCDYNIYDVSATDGKLASVTGIDKLNMGSLQEAFPGNDLHSGFGNPLLASPASAMATMDLKPVNFTPAEANGIAVASVTQDFAGLLRSAYTPVDIGAYAGNFTPAGPGQDIFFPIITYTPLLNSSLTTTRTTVNFATVTDYFTGVNTTSLTRPRLYYKKSTDANAFVGNTSANNGWKWVEASGTTSPFDFTINYSIIFGGSVVLADTIQYFVAAQDLATIPNVSFKPPTGASGSSVAPAGMTAPTTPNRFVIVPLLPATMDVGVGFTFTTLTGTLASGGLFAAMNAGVINANTVATIKTNIVEPGTVSLNQVNEEGPNAGTLTLTIQSDGVAHVISGTAVTASAPMISITGAKRFIIDGGAGKLLTFRNTNATPANTGPVIQFNNNSANCLVTNCILENNSASQTWGIVTFGTTGTNSATITSCDIRDSRGGTLGYPSCGIYSNSGTNNIQVLNNNIYNFKNASTVIVSYGVFMGTAANNSKISGNSFFMEAVAAPLNSETVIYLAGGSNDTISGNFIGGQAASCGGSAWTHTGTIVMMGIYMNSMSTGNYIQGNTIQNITLSNTGSVTFYGIQSNAGISANIIGNTIGHATTPNSIQIAGTGTSYGIYSTTSVGTNASFDQNVIANITLTNASGAPGFQAMRLPGGNARRNKIYSIGTSAAAVTSSIYGIYNTSTVSAYEFSNNMIALNGGNGTNVVLVGFYQAGASGTISFYYNSINIYGTATGASGTSAFNRAGGASFIVKNNILTNLRTGGTGKHYAIVSSPTTNFISDYNDLYVTGPILGAWGGVDKADIAAWKAIVISPLLDVNSKNTLPAYTSNANLYITADPNLANVGTPVSVTIDIDGVTRCEPPDIGINKFGVCIINLNMIVFLEGFYIGGGMMNTAMNFDGVTFGPKWGPTIADHVIIELHDAAVYSNLIYSVDSIPLNTNGTLTAPIPGIYNGSYYVTVKHKNCMETVTANPVLFNAPTINYNMSDVPTKAFGSNLKSLGGGVYALYSGDVSSASGIYPAPAVKDGVVDLMDNYYVYLSFLNGDFGYFAGDINGDGVVDLLDANLVYTNFLLGIYAITP